jgi:predicted O-linked N-acetylglucosamine transferase (SPINDLY family)
MMLLKMLGDAVKSRAPRPARDRAAKLGAEPAAQEVGALINLSVSGRYAELETLARSITTRFPGYARGWKALGAALSCQDRAEEALVPMRVAVDLAPADAEAHKNLGNALHQHGQLVEAMASYRRGLEIEPDSAEILCNLGNLCREEGRIAEAEASFRRAVQVKPDFAEAHYNLGNVLNEQHRYAEAAASFESAIKLEPDLAGTHNNLGLALNEQGRTIEAEASFRRAVELKADYAEAYNNLGSVLAAHGRLPEAERNYRRAITIEPDYVGALNNLGVTLKQQGRLAEAETCCRMALAVNPKHSGAHHNLGLILGDQGRFDEAEASLRQALSFRPDFADAFGNLLFILNYHPDRSAQDIFRDYQEYDARIGLQFRSSWCAHANDRNLERRLRVGYVSPDFRRHSCRSFLEPLLANHDKTRVEVFAYAALADEDEVTARYRSYVDRWIPTNGMTHDAVAKRIRDDGIDILVDLAGHTAGNLLPVFARKPAPISVSWLGYCYTTGLSAIDYYLTDKVCAPPGSDALFAEQPWRMATPCLVYQPTIEMGEVGTLPFVKRGYITFGTLTRSIRINHRTLRVWAELLKAVPGSRLLIDSRSYKYPAEQQQLASRFAEHGISRERLEIGFHSPPWDVLRSIDIGLDCFPHNSGTTLFESIYMGVPFITLAGRPSVGRIGSSVLQGMSRAEWIAESEADYVAKAAALARDPVRLAEIRAGLRDEMERSPLRDEAAFTRKMEAAYREMFANWCEKS